MQLDSVQLDIAGSAGSSGCVQGRSSGGTTYWIDQSTGRLTPNDPRSGSSSAVRADKLWDLVQLPEEELGPRGIANFLKRRYTDDEVYTWVGASRTVLVAVNPFKPLGIYTPSCALHFLATRDDSGQKQPHTFALAAEAYNSLRQGNQALLISGESGSGKTETTKHCLTLLAEAAGDSVGTLEQKVLCATPVLEAYGNAQTIANNNSSRFGKWMKLRFSRDGQLTGARIETYLLEKSRVTRHGEGERGFHIFYQLAAHADRLPVELELDNAGEFSYLCPGKARAAEDAELFLEVQHSLSQLGFEHDEVQWLWRATAAIMHLGNLSFEAVAGTGDQGGMQGSRVSGGTLMIIAQLLEVEEGELEKALTSKAIEVRGEVTVSPVGPTDAKMSADGFARTLHSELFKWLVEKVNCCLSGDEPATDDRERFIGILDIFGFEIFELNSFEQLCINFTNEKLQEHFNDTTFKEEQGLYKAEGIPFTSLEYSDNVEILALLEGSVGPADASTGVRRGSVTRSMGLLPLLDDTCRVPNGSERGFMDKCTGAFEKYKCWVPPKKGNAQDRFTILHYAGSVTYTVDGFMEKNRDQTMFGHVRLLRSSAQELYRKLVPPEPRKSLMSVPTTASANLRRQLNELMVTVKACDAKYVRCIKPNVKKRPGNFDLAYSEEQLRYGGVFETVNIRRRGLPFRMSHKSFVACYGGVTPSHPLNPCKAKDAPWAGMSTRDAAKAILRYVSAHEGDAPGDDPLAAAVGHTITFYRAEVNACLELLRRLLLEYLMPILIRIGRGYLSRKFRKAAVRANKALASALSVGTDLALAREAVSSATDPVLHLFAYKPAQLDDGITLANGLQLRVDLKAQMQEACRRWSQDVHGNAKLLMALLAKSHALTNQGIAQSAEQARIDKESLDLVKDHGATVLQQQIERAMQLPVRSVLQAIVQCAKVIEYRGEPLAEVQRVLALPDVEFAELQLQKATESGLGKVANDLRIQLTQLKAEMSPESCSLSSWPPDRIRDPREWYTVKNLPAVRTGVKTALAAGMDEEQWVSNMLRFQTWPIHAALLNKTTNYSWGKKPTSGTEKHYKDHDARVLFRNIMGYMGDRRHQYPDFLAAEFVNAAVGSIALASEAFAQLLKQLTNNPFPSSVDRGWQLFALLVHHAAPACEAECELVAGFIWLNAPESIRLKLLDKLFEQQHLPRRGAVRLDASEIPGYVQALWEAHGRPSLKLPRGSLHLLSGLEGLI